ncbi:DNA-3-methyladenine glycosylase family protein [Brevibacillus sp. B_LB10_24]|uniref:DNA-3-methyladenine glycosylase family protein n=1 Tax=Brevibacillus sp. B_LB10_24 TaxID=3380645 RepID=UPI0038B92E4F
MFQQTIVIKPPYSFQRLLHRLEFHPDPQLRIERESNTLHRAFRVGGQPVLVSLRFDGSVEEPLLHINTHAALTPARQAELLKLIRHSFSTDVDLAPLYGHMAENERLRLLAERFRGLRFLLDSDLFGSMVRTILGQQVNLAFAAALTDRLLTLAGDVLEDEQGNRYLAFPTAEAVARLEIPQLRELQFSQRKAEYIIDFARAVVDGKVDLERLQSMTDDEVIACLTPLRGIGRWSVECLLMFGMGRPDLLPAADIGLRNGIQLVYGIDEKLSEAQIRSIGEAWAPYRSYVSLYIWEAVGAMRRGEWQTDI